MRCRCVLVQGGPDGDPRDPDSARNGRRKRHSPIEGSTRRDPKLHSSQSPVSPGTVILYGKCLIRPQSGFTFVYCILPDRLPFILNSLHSFLHLQRLLPASVSSTVQLVTRTAASSYPLYSRVLASRTPGQC